MGSRQQHQQQQQQPSNNNKKKYQFQNVIKIQIDVFYAPQNFHTLNASFADRYLDVVTAIVKFDWNVCVLFAAASSSFFFIQWEKWK